MISCLMRTGVSKRQCNLVCGSDAVIAIEQSDTHAIGVAASDSDVWRARTWKSKDAVVHAIFILSDSPAFLATVLFFSACPLIVGLVFM